MRTFGKICSYSSAAGFTILAILAFNGYSLPQIVIGVFFALFAIESLVDGFVYFKKSEHIETGVVVHYANGFEEHLRFGKECKTESIPNYGSYITGVSFSNEVVEDD